jgi:hypothetical protein
VGDLVLYDNKLKPKQTHLGIILEDHSVKFSLDNKFFVVLFDDSARRLTADHHLELISSLGVRFNSI